ncbi:MAG: LTA synthase family protein [Bacteroidia bacterium]|nr:LTA synthase family protein [Bacteroidia bacterium]
MFNVFPITRILLQRLLIALLLAFICRIIFLIFNPVFFSFGFSGLVQAFFYGNLFDVSSIIYLNSLFILLHLLPLQVQQKKWYQQLLMVLFFICNGLSIILNLIDTGYFAFSGRRSGMELFSMGTELQGLKTAYIIDFWYLWVILIGMLVLMVQLYKRTMISALAIQVHVPQPTRIKRLLMLLFISVLLFLGARGSIGLLPLNTFDAARQTRPDLVPLVVNTPFNLILSTQQSGLQPVHYLPDVLVKNWFDPEQEINDLTGNKESLPNIVLIIVESLGKEYVGFYNNGKGYTPFLDSIMNYSTVFMHAYANGKKSVEGIPSILSAMPSWMNTPYLSSYYQSNRIKSAGAYLKETGYNSSFYHGGRNGTMSFDNFIAISGNGDYYGLNQYDNKNDFDDNWGIYDEPYLQYFARQLTLKPLPFFSTVFTLSSHHPYALPEAYKNKFPKGTLPIHPTIAYTDYALRQFFASARSKAWYANTVFIITADHSGENETPYYQSSQGKYEIPLILFKENSKKLQRVYQTVSQLDIMSLILKEAHYAKPFITFGDYFNKRVKYNNGAAIQYQDQYYQLIQWPYVYHFDGQKELGFYDLLSDSLMRNNLIIKMDINPPKQKMDSLLKSVLQQYHERLINNKTMR